MPVFVLEHVAGNGEHPGAEWAAGIVAVAAGPQAHEQVLGQVTGQFEVVACHAQKETLGTGGHTQGKGCGMSQRSISS